MTKRNLVLLIIILVIAIIGVFIFLYFNQGTGAGTGGENTQGINFFSIFNPFGSGKKATQTTIPPANISGYQPPPTSPTENVVKNLKLKKVSSMPIAGFTIFTKERLKPVLIPAPIDTTTNPTPPLPLSGEGASPVAPPAKGGSGGLKKIPVKPTPPLTEFMTALRYVERATGNVYQTFVDKIEEKRFSTTMIPKVYEAYFGDKGESVVMRYLKIDGRTIQTFVGGLPKEYLGADTTVSNEIKGSFLPENITDLSLSSDAQNIFYLFEVGDNAVGTTSNLLSGKKVQTITSPFTEWLSSWPNSKMITLTTKPSSGVPGYMYMTDPSGKILTKIFGGINGLTTLTSPNGKLVLFGDDNLSLRVYHMDTKASDLLGIRTLPEKCAWGGASDVVYCAVPKTTSASLYPDAWYQGEVSFSDNIWKIDIKTGNATTIVDPLTVEGGEEVDGVKLAMDPSENYLFFVNKKDSFLWELQLK